MPLRTSLVRPLPPPSPPPPSGCRTCTSGAPTGAITAGMGDAAKADIAGSPTLQRELAELQARGWKIEVDPGALDSTQTGAVILEDKTIVLRDGNDTLSIAHEVQHAIYENATPPPSLESAEAGTWSRQDFIDRYKRYGTADERLAFGAEATVRSEVLASGGRDIGQPAVFGEAYYDDHYTKLARQIHNDKFGIPAGETANGFDMNAFLAVPAPPPPATATPH